MVRPDSKFIELHHICGRAFIINVETIDQIYASDTGSRINLMGHQEFYVRETYDELKAFLVQASVPKQDDHP